MAKRGVIGESMLAYCIPCKAKVEMEAPIEKRYTKHGRYIHIGVCAKCGSKVSVIKQENNNVVSV